MLPPEPSRALTLLRNLWVVIGETAALSLIGLVSIGLIAAWLTSYKRNSDLIEQSLQADNEYAAAGAPLIKQTLIDDHDLDKVLPLIDWQL